eukprot:TRINITY_DN19260_c0_g1_i1.p1 TRINITY_DN19260_c0_g1~~TRINITY_DN19260_c0_g1_i1.p1  ORF type:complete len:606 (+),score=109.48 TRINITY_DN19260_c0_g1_i1:80-1897(+)
MQTRSIEVLKGTRLPEYEHRSGCSRVHHSMVSFRRSVYLYGGHEAESGIIQQNVVWRYNLEKSRWSSLGGVVAGRKYVKREGHTAVIWKTGMYVFGGHRGVSFCSDMQKFDLESFKWEKVEETKGSVVASPRFGHAALVYDDKMWVAGGFLKEDAPSVVACFSLLWKTWHHVVTPESIRTNAHSQPIMAQHDGRLYIIGLYQEASRSTDICIYHITTEQWIEIKGSGIPPDSLHSCGHMYTSPVHHPRARKLYVFMASSKRKTSFGSDMSVAALPYCLDISSMVWSLVRIEAFRLPKTTPTTAYDVKFTTCLVQDRILINGGIGSEHFFAAFTPAVEVVKEPTPPAKVLVSQPHQRRSGRPSEEDTQFDVGFVKEITYPATVFVDSSTPVLKLGTPEEIRAWQDATYAQQRGWLLAQFNDVKQDDSRRKIAEKPVKPDTVDASRFAAGRTARGMRQTGEQLQERFQKPRVTSQSSDKDILGMKLGMGLFVKRSDITLPCDKAIVPKKPATLWGGLRRVFAGAVGFKAATSTEQRLKRASLFPTTDAADDLDPPPTKQGDISEVVTSVAFFIDSVKDLGLIPQPPTGHELQKAIQTSAISHDPHLL